MMVCKVCGGKEFSANQVCYHEIIVDADGEFVKNDERTFLNGIYDAEKPYGPFTCVACGKIYEELT